MPQVKHVERLTLSGRQAIKNPSLLFVVLARLLFVGLLGVLFGLLNVALLSNGNFSGLGFLMTIVGLAELLLWVVVNGAFGAGFYFMVKNVTQDGSTTIREFLPGVKRFWVRFSGYVAVRWILALLLLLPFVVSVIYSPISFSGGVAALAPVHWFWLVFFLIGMLLVGFFWMLWGEAVIVYEDEAVVPAIIRSIKLANANIGKSVSVLLLSLLVFLAILVLLILLAIPYYAASSAPSAGAVLQSEALSLALDIVVYVVLMATFITIMLFIFHSYMYVGKKRKPQRKSMSR